MRILRSLFVVLVPLAGAQTLDSGKGPAKQPQTFAFPKPFDSAALQRALSAQTPMLVLRGTIPEPADAKVCAVRLLESKADTSVDPGILHPVPQDATKDQMPFRLPMAACPVQK